MNKTTISIVVVLFILIGAGIYFFVPTLFKPAPSTPNTDTVASTTQAGDDVQTGAIEDLSTVVIGKSAGGRDITAYHYGKGTTELLFVGGIHGGYEWNTVLVAYDLMDYLEQSPEAIPANVRVTVIPVLNPDGLNAVVGTAGRFAKNSVPSSIADTVPGRFNANNVDLNRNFDCDWKSTGVWQNTSVSGGSAVFSEPESQAFKAYIEANRPNAVVVWYSSAGGVFSSNCHAGVSAETKTLTNTFADASGYKAYEEFNFYEITGDMVNWLAKNNIPAISVLLSTHQDVEWDKNKAGVEALFKYYTK